MNEWTGRVSSLTGYKNGYKTLNQCALKKKKKLFVEARFMADTNKVLAKCVGEHTNIFKVLECFPVFLFVCLLIPFLSLILLFFLVCLFVCFFLKKKAATMATILEWFKSSLVVHSADCPRFAGCGFIGQTHNPPQLRSTGIGTLRSKFSSAVFMRMASRLPDTLPF